MTAKSWDRNAKRNSLYGRRWRKLRALFLSKHPLCAMCSDEGKTVPATVVDHVVPHRGNHQLFWDQSNWQPLCRRHHNSHKARLEIRGYSEALDPDGWPTDPQHPANSGTVSVSGRAMPDDLKRIHVPVLMVCGPPAAGKSTWCRQAMTEADMLIDFDEIDERINEASGRKSKLLVPILRERNRMLLSAAERREGNVFLPMQVSTAQTAKWWCNQLGNVKVVVIPTPQEICIERITAEIDCEVQQREMIERVGRWWSSYDIVPEATVTADGGTFDHGNAFDWTPRSHLKTDLVKPRQEPQPESNVAVGDICSDEEFVF